MSVDIYVSLDNRRSFGSALVKEHYEAGGPMQCPQTPTEESSSASESPKEPLADWLKWLGPENWKQIEATVATLFSGSLPEGGVGDGRQSREETGKKIMRTSS